MVDLGQKGEHILFTFFILIKHDLEHKKSKPNGLLFVFYGIKTYFAAA